VKYTFIIILSIIGISAGQAQSERSLIGDGNRMYRDKKYSDAEASYRKALEKNKELQQGAFNLGDALYQQERFGEAAEQYALSASRTSDPKIKAQAFHNLGNAMLKGKKIEESIAAYKNALKLNPNDADTKYNLEYAKALLKQQQEQNKNQKNDDKQKQDKKKQDQQKQDQQKQDQQKENQKKENQQKQPQDQKAQNDKQKEQQARKMQISKEDAERILEALKNEEKDVQKKLHKKVPARIKVEKDW